MDELERTVLKLDHEVTTLTEHLKEHEERLHKLSGVIQGGSTHGFELILLKLTNMAEKVDKLERKLDERSRTPWAAFGVLWAVSSTILGASGGYIVSNVNQDIARLEREIGEVRRETMPKAELEARSKVTQERIGKLEDAIRAPAKPSR